MMIYDDEHMMIYEHILNEILQVFQDCDPYPSLSVLNAIEYISSYFPILYITFLLNNVVFQRV